MSVNELGKSDIVTVGLKDMDLDIPDEAIVGRHALQKGIKRVLDITASCVLLLLMSPLLLIACAAICLESKGSPVYKQVRHGFRGRPFTAYKLRTMYEHSSEGNLSAPKKGDSRVTKVGWFLRKTSLDEIPQLINVIKGEMSIIGPRAVPQKEIELRLEAMIAHDPPSEKTLQRAMEIRALGKPGISGMAQAYGRSSLTVEQATSYDVFYVMHYSLRLDLKIFFKTVDTVFHQKGVN